MSLTYGVNANGLHKPIQLDANDKIHVNDVNTTSIDTRLDNTIGHINNSGAIGSGQSALRTCPVGYNRTDDTGHSFLVDSSGRQSTILTGNSNAAGSGTNYHITCDSGGRMYVNSDLGIPVNALTDAGANQSLRTDGIGSLRVVSKKAYSDEVVLVNAQAISGSGTFTTSAFTNDANIESFLIEHQFSHVNIEYEVLESLDNSFFVNASTQKFNESGAPTTLIQTLNSIQISAPYFKLKFTNGEAGAQTLTNVSYVATRTN